MKITVINFVSTIFGDNYQDCMVILFTILESSSTDFEYWKHVFHVMKHERACRHVEIGPVRNGRFTLLLVGAFENCFGGMEHWQIK
jgi:hypothetical protein